jgi:hypothetical protein
MIFNLILDLRLPGWEILTGSTTNGTEDFWNQSKKKIDARNPFSRVQYRETTRVENGDSWPARFKF